MSHRKRPLWRTEVKIVYRKRLLKDRWVWRRRNCHLHRVHMTHVVPAYDVGTVCQTIRMLVIGRSQQKRRRVDRPARHDDYIRRILLESSISLHDGPGYGPARRRD